MQEIEFDAKSVLINGKPIKGRVILAHGAGAGMESDFMQIAAERLAALGLEVVRIEFPYMQKSREDGKRRPPDKIDKLLTYFTQVIAYYSDERPLYLAGKSMGGRVASMLLEQSSARAAFVFGYPFHPRGKPDSLRTEHLKVLAKPLFILQGERDPMGSFDEVSGYNLSPSVALTWLGDGDHDLKPRVRSGFTQEEHLATAFDAIKRFVS